MRDLVVLLGIPIDNLSLHEAIDQIDRFVQKGRIQNKHHLVVTVNADFVTKAKSDPELRYLLQEADLATADGMPLVWAARLLGVPLKGRVTGADMVPALAERAAQKGYSIFLLGAGPGVAQEAASVLQATYPGLKIAGVATPPYTNVLEMDTTILADISAAQPDILMVAFGNPKQEKWIGMYGHQLKVPVMMGVGASLDFVAGQVKRAPLWMQNSGFEWVFRLIQEPRRLWSRYVVDLFSFSSFFIRQWWVMRGAPTSVINLPLSETILIKNKVVLNIQGRLTIQNTKEFLETAGKALDVKRDLLVNLARLEFVDSTGIGALVNLAKQAKDAGVNFSLVAVPPQIHKTLSLLRLGTFFHMMPNVDVALNIKTDDEQVTKAFYSSKLPATQANQMSWTVIKGPRRFDASTSHPFKQACSTLIEENPYLILDFSETVILASAGLSVLAQLNSLTLKKNGKLKVINCSNEVLQTIRLVRMDKILDIYPGLTAALT